MVALSSLRLARLQRGLSLDEVSFRTNGRLNPGRLSRVERGYVKPNDDEVRLLQEVLGVSSELINDSLEGCERTRVNARRAVSESGAINATA